MKRIEKLRIRIIDAPTAEECEEQVNRALDEVSLNKPKLDRDSTKPFCFYIYYSVSENVAESKSDQYILDGINLYCQDCPNFVLPDDKRLGCRCALTHGHINPNNRICDKGIDALELLDRLGESK